MDVKEILKEKENIRDYFDKKSWLQKCPFHKDKTASLSINREGTLFNCFGCDASWDIFSFLEKLTGSDFSDIIKDLAEKHNVPLYTKGKEVSEYYEKASKMRQLLSDFGEVMSDDENHPYTRYIKERNISNEMIKEFGIWYGGDNWYEMGGIVKDIDTWHIKKGYFLLSKRIIFTIHDERGRPIAFSWRKVDEDDFPKYINTSTNDVYVKSETLYNFHRAKDPAKSSWYLFIVEGQMDVIRLWSMGIKNVVAPCGTAFTPWHATLIQKKLPDVQVVVMMDNDQAGIKASYKILEIMKEQYPMIVDIAKMDKECKDIDEYIVKHGISGEILMKHKEEGIGYIARRASASRADATLQKKKAILDFIRKFVSKDDAIMADIQYDILNKEFGLKIDTMREAL